MRHSSLFCCLFFAFCFAVAHGQTMPAQASKSTGGANTSQISVAKTSAQRPAGSNTNSATNRPSKDEFIFSFDRVPTFADHDREAAIKEANLPIRFPVLPIYNVSEDLPGYIDVLRRVSMMTFEGIEEDRKNDYNTPWDLVMEIQESSKIEAEYNPNLQLLSEEIIHSAAGDDFLISHFDYFSDGEQWGRFIMSTASREAEGLRYIQVVIHYPKKFEDLVQNEMAYYFDQAVINPYKSK